MIYFRAKLFYFESLRAKMIPYSKFFAVFDKFIQKKNDFAESSKILLETDLKIILLEP